MRAAHVAKALLPFVQIAIERAAAKPGVPLQPLQARPLAEAVVNEMKDMPAVVTAMTPKPWWQSMTIQSIAVMVVAGVLAKFGYAVAPEDLSAGVDQLGQILFLFGSIGALVGRIRASRTVR